MPFHPYIIENGCNPCLPWSKKRSPWQFNKLVMLWPCLWRSSHQDALLVADPTSTNTWSLALTEAILGVTTSFIFDLQLIRIYCGDLIAPRPRWMKGHGYLECLYHVIGYRRCSTGLKWLMWETCMCVPTLHLVLISWKFLVNRVSFLQRPQRISTISTQLLLWWTGTILTSKQNWGHFQYSCFMPSLAYIGECCAL